ncbi:hypothetical protein GCM10010140_77350 [Streptosporangium pseudovulgare]|uniref:DUF4158 domain-containing protein n=1 Tax=Streptosporangium pseudovulgare TaxID=35765 RepID=A0ABQ2RPD7_9ACTN|nr:hypothetical protein GCM10010140_77350 [Streptosporangium pseudovulgare]
MRREWEPEELIAAWTLLDSDWDLMGNKTGATRLGFGLLLKFFEQEGRFPRHAGEVPRAAVDYMAGQVKADAAAGVVGGHEDGPVPGVVVALDDELVHAADLAFLGPDQVVGGVEIVQGIQDKHGVVAVDAGGLLQLRVRAEAEEGVPAVAVGNAPVVETWRPGRSRCTAGATYP